MQKDSQHTAQMQCRGRTLHLWIFRKRKKPDYHFHSRLHISSRTHSLQTLKINFHKNSLKNSYFVTPSLNSSLTHYFFSPYSPLTPYYNHHKFLPYYFSTSIFSTPYNPSFYLKYRSKYSLIFNLYNFHTFYALNLSFFYFSV